MNKISEGLPPDAFQKAMREAIPRYTGEKSVRDLKKNPIDSRIDGPDEDPEEDTEVP